MMTKREFYNRFGSELMAHKKSIAAMVAEIEDLSGDLTSGRYSAKECEAIRATISQKRNDIANAKERAANACKGICRSYQKEIESDGMRLDPAELSDDVKLLNAGVTLSVDMLRQLAARNSNNTTMTNLIRQYAADHGHDPSVVGITGGAAERQNTIKNLAVCETIAEKVIARADHPYMPMFERLVDTGSMVERAFNVNEDGTKGEPINWNGGKD